MQVYASPKLEIFASSAYNTGKASISGLDYRTSQLAAPIAGLDFDLMNASFAGFSDMHVREVVHTAGVNYRLTDRLVANASAEYHDYRDSQPYLFDTTGRRVLTYFGVNWLF